MEIVVLRDIKADAYHNPAFVQTIGGAIRAFQDEATSTEKNPISNHPEDYELYHYGKFEELTGKFVLLDEPKQIAVGSNFKKA